MPALHRLSDKLEEFFKDDDKDHTKPSKLFAFKHMCHLLLWMSMPENIPVQRPKDLCMLMLGTSFYHDEKRQQWMISVCALWKPE